MANKDDELVLLVFNQLMIYFLNDQIINYKIPLHSPLIFHILYELYRFQKNFYIIKASLKLFLKIIFKGHLIFHRIEFDYYQYKYITCCNNLFKLFVGIYFIKLKFLCLNFIFLSLLLHNLNQIILKIINLKVFIVLTDINHIGEQSKIN